MNKQDTISLQEVRKDPLSFLRQINQGKTLVVIYHSKPFATVRSADTALVSRPKSTKQMLEYARQARSHSKSLDTDDKSLKQLYADDMAKKYGIS
jgi:hypothetical protein